MFGILILTVIIALVIDYDSVYWKKMKGQALPLLVGVSAIVLVILFFSNANDTNKTNLKTQSEATEFFNGSLESDSKFSNGQDSELRGLMADYPDLVGGESLQKYMQELHDVSQYSEIIEPSRGRLEFKPISPVVSTTPRTGSRYYDSSYRPAVGNHYVEGHYREDGSYVQGHYKTNSDDSFYNNWSTSGNVNPYTGRLGTKTPSSERYSGGKTFVSGYYRKDGTYVRSHTRSR
jgi:hypothetical protein